MSKLLDNIKHSFSNRKFKNGAYSTIISLIVIVIIVVVNLFAGELNMKADLSKDNKYTITKQTKEFANTIKDDITLYYMAGDDSKDTIVEQIVNQYDEVGKKIKVEGKDPVLYPQFASKYTSDEVPTNSVIVVNKSNDRSKVVNYNDMFIKEVDYNTYQEQTTGIDVEGQITSALEYVTTGDLPKLYQVEGHGELEISNSLASTLAKENVTSEKLNTLSSDSIPEDCSVLLINGPQHDLSEKEATVIREYLKAGGDAIILASYTTEDTPIFDSILSDYGVTLAQGVVIEGDSNYYMSGTPTYLIPSISSHDITSDIQNSNMPVVVPVAKGLQVSDSLKSTVTIDPILTSSNSSYSKVNVNSSTYEKESSDIDGPFDLGVAITDTYNGQETKIAVYGSSYVIDESMVSMSALGNTDLFINSINWMTGTKDGLSIPTRSLETTYLTINAAQTNFYAALVVIIIPFILIITGVVVTLKRRKR